MPAITEQFSIDVTGESGQKYPGIFKAKPRLSHRDALLQDQFRRDLLGPKADQPVAGGAQAVADVFSKIWVHLTEAPLWWREAGNGIDLIDEAPVAAVYKEILRIEREAIEKVLKKGEEAKESIKAPEAAAPLAKAP